MNKKILIFILIFPLSILNSEEYLSGPFFAWDSKEGLEKLEHCKKSPNFWNLLRFYECQYKPTYCAIASSVASLNALLIENQNEMITQKKFVNRYVSPIKSIESVLEEGINLPELSAILENTPLLVEAYSSENYSSEELLFLLSFYVKCPKKIVLILYDRSVVGQNGIGHWSPLIGYDKKSNYFLVMDVTKYKYPPCWIRGDLLVSAIKTKDSLGINRGFIVLNKIDRG